MDNPSSSHTRRPSSPPPSLPLNETSIRFSGLDHLREDTFTPEPLAVADGFSPASRDRGQPPATPLPADHVPSSHLRSSANPGGGTDQSVAIETKAQEAQREKAGIANNEPPAFDPNPPDARSMPPSGPTHPYSMYAQGTGIGRSLSNATGSTTQPTDPTFAGSNAPHHPYALYPQNTHPEGASPNSNPSPAGATIGPSIPASLYPRPSPSPGEDPDMISPYGPREQLPPYTKYPTDIPPKGQGQFGQQPSERSIIPRPLPSSTSRTSQHVVTSETPSAAPAPVISQSTITSQDSPSSPHSHISSQSVLSNSSNQRLTPAPPTDPPPMLSSKEKWTQRGERRVCRGMLPVWVIVLMVLAVVLVGALIGGIVGGVLGNKLRKHDQQLAQEAAASPTATVVATLTTYDTSPLHTTPAGLPSLAMGGYTLLLRSPQEISNDCLTDSSQSQAWSCEIAPQIAVAQMLISPMQEEGINAIQMLSPASMDETVRYGMQPPVISGPQTLSLVTDMDDPGKGPAWVWQASYNKRVVLRSEDLEEPGLGKRASIKLGSRAFGRGDNLAYSRKQSATVAIGDQPWYCSWPAIIEGFIYPNISSRATPSESTTTPAVTPTTPPAQSGSAASTGTLYGREPIFPAFPQLVKLEEHRDPSAVGTGPTCQRMQVLNDLSVEPVPQSDGSPIMVNLSVTEPTMPGMRMRSVRELIRPRQNSGTCYCQWTIL
ncbi:MAG: hypothetical protein M1817_000007 [Caeruleum heppii]|nr:MAG: hypothetical protein M1817_000007 [Caeruleum heppii]